MFGIICLAINTITGLVSDISHGLTTAEWKYKAIEEKENGKNPSSTYIDSYGRPRDIQTNVPVQFDWDDKHHLIAYARRNDRTGKLEYLRDVTEEKYKLEIEKKKKEITDSDVTVVKGKSEYIIKKELQSKNILDRKFIKGDRIVDIKTGEEYVVRCVRIYQKYKDEISLNNIANKPIHYFGWCNPGEDKTLFYMNIKNCHLVRRTDGQRKKDCIYGNNGNAIKIENTDEFIKEFNDIQDKYKSTLDLNNIDIKENYYWRQSGLGSVKVKKDEYEHGKDKYCVTNVCGNEEGISYVTKDWNIDYL